MQDREPATGRVSGVARSLVCVFLLFFLVGCAHRQRFTLPAPVPVVVAQPEPAALTILDSAAADLEVTLRRRALVLLVLHSPEAGGGGYALRGLYDPDPYVKRAVIGALLARPTDPLARQRLLDMAQRVDMDGYTRGSVALSLALAGERAHAIALSAAWPQAGAGWSAAPLALAAAVMGDVEAEQALQGFLRNGEFPLETNFFLDLGRSGLSGLVPAMEEGLSQVEEELRLPLAASLVQLGSDRGAFVFRSDLSGADELLALEAIDYLALLEGPVAWHLMKQARHSDRPLVSRYAELVLLARGQGNPRLAARWLRSEDRELRAMVLDALASGCADSACRGLARRSMERGLADEEVQVLLSAARGLGRVGNAADRQQLLPLLEHEDRLVQVEAAGALLLIGAMADEAGRVSAQAPAEAAPATKQTDDAPSGLPAPVEEPQGPQPESHG